MKSNLNSILSKSIFAFIFLLVSCGSVTEEIYLNEDGSGSYTMYTDMIGSAKTMMTTMMEGFYPDLDKDSLNELVEEQLWKDFPDEVDSLVDLSSKVPDSIKSDPAKMRLLSAMEVFMKGSRAEGYMNMGTTFQFKDVDELEEFLKLLAENQGAAGGAGTDMLGMPQIEVDYSFDGNTFSRKSAVVEKQELEDSVMMGMKMMFGEARTRTIVHLPGRVKKASKNQLVSSEGKDVVYEYSLIGYLTGEETSDFEIQLKN